METTETISATCPICGAQTASAGSKTGLRTGKAFSLRRCPECGFTFVEQPWVDYKTIYDEAYYRGEGSDPLVDYAFEYEHPGLTVRNYEWRGVENIVRELSPAPGKWLDYGCGNGGLVRHALKSGQYEVFGYDTGAWAEKSRDGGLPVLRESELAEHEGTFDIITMIEVIEHVTAPLDFFCECRRWLKPGGWLFLTTGNAASAPKDFLSWPYVSPEIHVSYFTPKALSLALKQAGFEPRHMKRFSGWNDIVRFKVLKNLKCRKRNILERMIPWTIVSPMVDARYKVSAFPIAQAV